MGRENGLAPTRTAILQFRRSAGFLSLARAGNLRVSDENCGPMWLPAPRPKLLTRPPLPVRGPDDGLGLGMLARSLARMARPAQRLQVAPIIRPTLVQRRDVIDLLRQRGAVMLQALTAQRLGFQHGVANSHPSPAACALHVLPCG